MEHLSAERCLIPSRHSWNKLKGASRWAWSCVLHLCQSQEEMCALAAVPDENAYHCPARSLYLGTVVAMGDVVTPPTLFFVYSSEGQRAWFLLTGNEQGERERWTFSVLRILGQTTRFSSTIRICLESLKMLSREQPLATWLISGLGLIALLKSLCLRFNILPHPYFDILSQSAISSSFHFQYQT